MEGGRKPSEPPVERGSTEQRSQAPADWSHLEPYEEGRAGDLPTDDRALFGDFASRLLEGGAYLPPMFTASLTESPSSALLRSIHTCSFLDWI